MTDREELTFDQGIALVGRVEVWSRDGNLYSGSFEGFGVTLGRNPINEMSAPGEMSSEYNYYLSVSYGQSSLGIIEDNRLKEIYDKVSDKNRERKERDKEEGFEKARRLAREESEA